MLSPMKIDQSSIIDESKRSIKDPFDRLQNYPEVEFEVK
jgi:hypothetical protein